MILPILDSIIYAKTVFGHNFPLPTQEENVYVVFEAKCNACKMQLKITGKKFYHTVTIDEYVIDINDNRNLQALIKERRDEIEYSLNNYSPFNSRYDLDDEDITSIICTRIKLMM